MGRIKVTNRINDYSEPPKQSIVVDAHWCYSNLVVIVTEENAYTVDGGELIKAIKNAMNA